MPIKELVPLLRLGPIDIGPHREGKVITSTEHDNPADPLRTYRMIGFTVVDDVFGFTSFHSIRIEIRVFASGIVSVYTFGPGYPKRPQILEGWDINKSPFANRRIKYVHST